MSSDSRRFADSPPPTIGGFHPVLLKSNRALFPFLNPQIYRKIKKRLRDPPMHNRYGELCSRADISSYENSVVIVYLRICK